MKYSKELKKFVIPPHVVLRFGSNVKGSEDALNLRRNCCDTKKPIYMKYCMLLI